MRSKSIKHEIKIITNNINMKKKVDIKLAINFLQLTCEVLLFSYQVLKRLGIIT